MISTSFDRCSLSQSGSSLDDECRSWQWTRTVHKSAKVWAPESNPIQYSSLFIQYSTQISLKIYLPSFVGRAMTLSDILSNTLHNSTTIKMQLLITPTNQNIERFKQKAVLPSTAIWISQAVGEDYVACKTFQHPSYVLGINKIITALNKTEHWNLMVGRILQFPGESMWLRIYMATKFRCNPIGPW